MTFNLPEVKNVVNSMAGLREYLARRRQRRRGARVRGGRAPAAIAGRSVGHPAVRLAHGSSQAHNAAHVTESLPGWPRGTTSFAGSVWRTPGPLVRIRTSISSDYRSRIRPAALGNPHAYFRKFSEGWACKLKIMVTEIIISELPKATKFIVEDSAAAEGNSGIGLQRPRSKRREGTLVISGIKVQPHASRQLGCIEEVDKSLILGRVPGGCRGGGFAVDAEERGGPRVLDNAVSATASNGNVMK